MKKNTKGVVTRSFNVFIECYCIFNSSFLYECITNIYTFTLKGIYKYAIRDRVLPNSS